MHHRVVRFPRACATSGRAPRWWRRARQSPPDSLVAASTGTLRVWRRDVPGQPCSAWSSTRGPLGGCCGRRAWRTSRRQPTMSMASPAVGGARDVWLAPATAWSSDIFLAAPLCASEESDARCYLMVDTLSWVVRRGWSACYVCRCCAAPPLPFLFAYVVCILPLVALLSHPLCTDVDVEALMRSTLDATREFDAFLVSLVHEAPPEAIALRKVCCGQRDAPMKDGGCVVVLKRVRPNEAR